MGKHRDRREPRHRSFDDDRSYLPDRDTEPSYFQRSPAATPHSVGAEVLWFNAEKGFGFVKAADGSEAFLHIKTLEAAGNSGVSEGAQLKVRIEEGQKGKQVAEVLEVSGGTAPSRPAQRPARGVPRQAGSDAQEEESEGTVKWYSPDKGFGFIGLDSGEKDIFVHATALTRSGLAELSEGQKVVVRYAQGQKGPEARTIRPA